MFKIVVLPPAATCTSAGMVVTAHRSGADMQFLSTLAAAVTERERSRTVLLTGDDGEVLSCSFLEATPCYDAWPDF